MKKVILFIFLLLPLKSPAFMGSELPLLAEIVVNTLNTMKELQRQSDHLSDELRGINDRIHRLQSISNLVQPETWKDWGTPEQSLKRLQVIYHTLPKEYKNKKSDLIEKEISKAMQIISKLSKETERSFKSGNELERRGADASPGVAQKLTASGVGTLVKLQSQSQIVQSHITSLLSQMLANANEKEVRIVVSRKSSLKDLSKNLSGKNRSFSDAALKKDLN